MTASDSGSRKFIYVDRTACAVVLLFVLGLTVAAVFLARAASPFVASLLVTATPAPTPTLAAASPGKNVAYNGIVTVSRTQPGFPASLAVDGNQLSWWGSGEHAPQWLEIDMGGNYVVSVIRLLPSQTPAGVTVHDVYVRGTATNDDYLLLHTFDGPTSDSKWLSYAPPDPIRGVRYVRVETVSSPSWVSWREIEVIALE
ncbi:MAG TPA: discoidin domain-containing protein [Anaerolineales bacterium]|nr:discoidin domain-containing protein [Anaerolineales bacterium]